LSKEGVRVQIDIQIVAEFFADDCPCGAGIHCAEYRAFALDFPI
jgi:hypothetical protein